MYQDDRSTCRAIVIIITPFVFFKMSLTCRDNFFVVKNVMTFKTCPLVRIGPNSIVLKCFFNTVAEYFFDNSLFQFNCVLNCHLRAHSGSSCFVLFCFGFFFSKKATIKDSELAQRRQLCVHLSDLFKTDKQRKHGVYSVKATKILTLKNFKTRRWKASRS